MDSLPAEPQGKPKNPGVGSLSFLQQIFPTQELDQSLLHYKWILYQLRHQGNSCKISCKNSETGLLWQLILRQADTEAHGLIVWGRVLEWCLKSFWYIGHPVKSLPHYEMRIWLSIEPDEYCLWLVGSQRWRRSSHRFDPQIGQLTLLLYVSQTTCLFLLPPCPGLQPLFFVPYQPAPTTFSHKTWTPAFLSFIFPLSLQHMILSCTFNLHLITDVSQSYSGSMLLVTWVLLPRRTEPRSPALQADSLPSEPPGKLLPLKWASLVTRTIMNLPAMWETWIQSLGWEDPLEEGMATHSIILAWRIPMDRETWRAMSMGSQRVRHDWATKHSTAQYCH